jgi:TetR/AcrR family transcriptional repressor of nem operon
MFANRMGRPREFDIEETLVKVREEFWRHGYAATSVDRLMEATNLGKGSLYAAFGDKRALFLRVLSEYASARVAAFRDLHNGAPRAIDALRATLRPMFGVRGCFLANCTVELSPHDGEVVALARTTFAALETIVAETVRRAMDERDLPEATRPGELAAVILAIASGLEFLGRTGIEAAAIERVGRNAARELLGDGGRGTRPSRRSRARP